MEDIFAVQLRMPFVRLLGQMVVSIVSFNAVSNKFAEEETVWQLAPSNVNVPR